MFVDLEFLPTNHPYNIMQITSEYYRIGNLYKDDPCLVDNYKYWLTKAANNGHYKSQIDLVDFYLKNGDCEMASTLFIIAILNMPTLDRIDKKINFSCKIPFEITPMNKIIIDNANNGDNEAQYKLAQLYRGNDDQYIYWLQKSAQSYNYKAKCDLVYYYLDHGNKQAATLWFNL